MTYESDREEETFSLGFKMGSCAKPGDVYSLTGDLGTGKTVFTAGFAKGLAINTPICSPTFTIMQVYDEGRIPLYHFDVYRIDDEDEMHEIGFDDFLFGSGVCLIEWGEKVESLLPEGTVHILIEKDLDRGFDFRRITIDDNFSN